MLNVLILKKLKEDKLLKNVYAVKWIGNVILDIIELLINVSHKLNNFKITKAKSLKNNFPCGSFSSSLQKIDVLTTTLTKRSFKILHLID